MHLNWAVVLRGHPAWAGGACQYQKPEAASTFLLSLAMSSSQQPAKRTRIAQLPGRDQLFTKQGG
jgi:hypothetical protein